MTPLQNTANQVLNAMDEAKVGVVINLYDVGFLSKSNDPSLRKEEIKAILLHPALSLGEEDADYWLNWYHVT